FFGGLQGGIISPILSNIYLNELDVYMEKYIKKFNKGKARAKTKELRYLETKMYRMRKAMKESWDSLTVDEKAKGI
ncbi:group II intron reverse transcriptase/maturase, partial [Priestia endophytica]|nr:group II intron reverse transcriptase/maturase [Priestia endophytica]